MYMQGNHPFAETVKHDWDGIFGSRRRLSDKHNEESPHSVLEGHELTTREHKAESKHKKKNKKYYRRPNDFLVNLRSPLDRIASWFIYEHAENHGSSK